MMALKTLTLSIILRLAGTMFQSFISLASCVVYVVSTYYQNEYQDIFDTLEVTFAALFSLDYTLGIYNAKNKVLNLNNLSTNRENSSSTQ
jgi:hypothetical protein